MTCLPEPLMPVMAVSLENNSEKQYNVHFILFKKSSNFSLKR